MAILESLVLGLAGFTTAGAANWTLARLGLKDYDEKQPPPRRAAPGPLAQYAKEPNSGRHRPDSRGSNF